MKNKIKYGFKFVPCLEQEKCIFNTKNKKNQTCLDYFIFLVDSWSWAVCSTWRIGKFIDV